MPLRRSAVTTLIAVALCVFGTQAAAGQRVTPVPKLDLNRFVGVWYVMARYPDKMEKQCTRNDTILFALGTKANTFQMGIFCHIKADISSEWDAHGKMDKMGDGDLKVTHIWPFRKTYTVMALGPQYEWALLGTSNHKMLWILSRAVVLTPDVLTQIEGIASSQGYDTSKLIQVPQQH